jgi:hypothetical protein
VILVKKDKVPVHRNTIGGSWEVLHNLELEYYGYETGREKAGPISIPP